MIQSIMTHVAETSAWLYGRGMSCSDHRCLANRSIPDPLTSAWSGWSQGTWHRNRQFEAMLIGRTKVMRQLAFESVQKIPIVLRQ